MTCGATRFEFISHADSAAFLASCFQQLVGLDDIACHRTCSYYKRTRQVHATRPLRPGKFRFIAETVTWSGELDTLGRYEHTRRGWVYEIGTLARKAANILSYLRRLH